MSRHGAPLFRPGTAEDPPVLMVGEPKEAMGVSISPPAGDAYVPTVFVGMYAPFGRYHHTILSMAKDD